MGESRRSRSRAGVARRGAVAASAGLSVAALLVLPPADTAVSATAGSASVSSAAAWESVGGVPAPHPPRPAMAAPGSTPPAVRLQPAALVRTGEALSASGIPAVALRAYQRAANVSPAGCHVSWPLIAAIGRVESDHGRFGGAVLAPDGLSSPPILGPVLNGSGGTARILDTDHGRLDGDPAYDRAVGPMQFIPSTWARYGVDGTGDGRADPFDIVDAAQAAASYLCAAGGDLASPAGPARAVLAYNHSPAYVATVLALAATYAGSPVRVPPVPPPSPTQVQPADPAPPPALAAVRQGTGAPPGTGGPRSSPTPAPVPTAVATPAASTSATAGPTATPTAISTPTATPTPGGSCGPAGPKIVDVVDGTGRPRVATHVIARLTAAGLRVGTMTTSRTVTTSAIEYSAGTAAGARALAGALDPRDGPPYLRAAPASAQVPHVTVVLGATDFAAMVALFDTFTGLPATGCPSSPATP